MAFSYEIIKNFGIVEEAPTSDWGILFTQLSFNGKAPQYDIRKWNLDKIDEGNENDRVMGKGVSFYTDEGLYNLTHMLIENGFGDTDKIKELLNERNSSFSFLDEIDDELDDELIDVRRTKRIKAFTKKGV